MPEHKIKIPSLDKGLNISPIFKWYSGSSDLHIDIYETGIFAFGYIIINGTNTPWSYPL
jgi:hypothetical protein